MTTNNNQQQWIRLLQIFSAKLVLEVFGGGGAIWGFSEVLTLRTPHTVWFWRPCAATIGAVFFVRWILQIQDYVNDNGMKLKFIPQQFQLFDSKHGYGVVDDDAEHLSMLTEAEDAIQGSITDSDNILVV